MRDQSLAERVADKVQAITVHRFDDGSVYMSVSGTVVSRSDLTQFAALLLAIGNNLFPVANSVSSSSRTNAAETKED